MKVSFDFDGTLSRKDVQKYARELVDKGFDVWIVTSRVNTETALKNGWHWIEKQNQDLYNVAEECGILRENIKFTDHVDKIVFLKGKNFKFHLDDDEIELMLILESDDNCIPLNVNHSDWLYHCENVIES